MFVFGLFEFFFFVFFFGFFFFWFCLFWFVLFFSRPQNINCTLSKKEILDKARQSKRNQCVPTTFTGLKHKTREVTSYARSNQSRKTLTSKPRSPGKCGTQAQFCYARFCLFCLIFFFTVRKHLSTIVNLAILTCLSPSKFDKWDCNYSKIRESSKHINQIFCLYNCKFNINCLISKLSLWM